jgi:predicted extracellular nuclease
MNPKSTHIPAIAAHISTHLGTPDFLFIQEIQDNSGPTDDGTTSGNLTLAALVTAIAKVSNVTYDFLEIAPQDGTDGGQPGGNIRQAYL